MAKNIRYKYEGQLLDKVKIVQDAYDHARNYDRKTRKKYLRTIEEVFDTDRMNNKLQTLYIPIFGLIMLLVGVAFAYFNPFPSFFQSGIYWAAFTIFAALGAALIPGFIEVNYQGWLRAGGAIAVVVIFWFTKPAVSEQQMDSGTITTITLDVFEHDTVNFKKINVNLQKNNTQKLADYLPGYLNSAYGMSLSDSIVCFIKESGKIISSTKCHDLSSDEVIVVPINIISLFIDKRSAYEHLSKK